MSLFLLAQEAAAQAPLWQEIVKDLLLLAGIFTAIGVIVKVPIINRPIRWLWYALVAKPVSNWSKEVVGTVVDDKINSPDAASVRSQLVEFTTFQNDVSEFVETSRSYQNDMREAMRHLHECVDRRASESNERIEKLTAYTEEVLSEAVGAKERIRQLYKALEIPVFETDALGHCTYVNPAYSELTGLSVDEALGEGWSEAIMPEDRSRVFQTWESATRAAIDFNSIYRFKNVRTGAITQVRGSAKPLHDGKGVVVGWVGTVDPIKTSM